MKISADELATAFEVFGHEEQLQIRDRLSIVVINSWTAIYIRTSRPAIDLCLSMEIGGNHGSVVYNNYQKE